ncbi:MAG: histidine phosphatase family protein [Bacillota bacterium]|jgi:broad specificity phosphatase PhoE
MAELILVRHGETLWNREARWQGQENVPLSKMGLEQAGCLARRFAHLGSAPLWSSDLERATRTAEGIASVTGSSTRVHPGLREVLMGCWQGLTHPEVLAKYPKSCDEYFSDFVQGRAPRGESFGEMAGRVRAALDLVVSEAGGRPCVVVTHGGPIKAAVCDVLGISYDNRWRLAVDNASVTRVYWHHERGALLSLNDTCHLGRHTGRPGWGI